MLLLGHVGITLGVAGLLNSALSKNHAPAVEQGNPEIQYTPESVTLQNSTSASKTAPWLVSLGDRIDIRILLIGSMLPDIIDKPVGLYFFRDTFSTGRIFCHTLLFLIFITLVGVCLYKLKGKPWLLVLSFGTFIHLLSDQMWLAHKTFLWPFYGLAFEREDITDWATKMLHALHTDPSVYLPEFAGMVVLIWFILVLVYRKKFYSFIKDGNVS